jgi:hypothetical protein
MSLRVLRMAGQGTPSIIAFVDYSSTGDLMSVAPPSYKAPGNDLVGPDEEWFEAQVIGLSGGNPRSVAWRPPGGRTVRCELAISTVAGSGNSWDVRAVVAQGTYQPENERYVITAGEVTGATAILSGVEGDSDSAAFTVTIPDGYHLSIWYRFDGPNGSTFAYTMDLDIYNF